MTNFNKNIKRSNNRKKDTIYNADNEIIIGVTTRQKENKVRVDSKTTRTSNKIKKTKNSKNEKINDSKNKKQTKKVQIKKKNGKKILVGIAFLIFLLIGGTSYYLTTPIFNISSIEIYGNSVNSKDTYISLSKISIGNTNIFAFTNSSIERNIKENAYVDTVSIKRKLPNILEIHIKERNVDYQAQYLDKYIYLDHQGYILEINDNKREIPMIDGLEIINENIQIGQRLNDEDLTKLEVIYKIINYCKYNNVQSNITSINVKDTTNYILNVENEEKKIYLGDSSNLTEKMDLAINIMMNEKGKKGEIFVKEELVNKNRVYFREEN